MEGVTVNESQATIIGNLTADPALTFTNDARAVVQATVAVTRRYQAGGEWKEQTSFLKVAAFGQLAENMAASLHKGDRVVCVGRLQTDSYETKTGEKRSDVQLVLDHCGVSLQWVTVEISKALNDARAQHPAARRLAVVSDEEPF